MLAITLVRQHMAYASAHLEEFKQFKTIWDHMHYYLRTVHRMSRSEAALFLANLKYRNIRSQDISPLVKYLLQPATHKHLAVYTVFVQSRLSRR